MIDMDATNYVMILLKYQADKNIEGVYKVGMRADAFVRNIGR